MQHTKTTHLLDESVRIHQLDKIIGKIRIVIALFIILVQYLAGHRDSIAITSYFLLLCYSAIWLLFQSKNSSQSINKLGYFHIIADLSLMAVVSYFSVKNNMSYFNGLYIILTLMYLIRFGRKPTLWFVAIVSIQVLYTCINKHLTHSVIHFITLGTTYAIIYFVGNIIELESNLRKKLKYISTHDELTGVHNYRYFQELLNAEVERSNRYQSTFSMIILDIDNFKKFNDSFGHDAGNEVLIMVSNLVKENVRNSDFIARYGGEEFIILMPETNKKGAITLAERVRKSIADHKFPYRKVTISLGVATYPIDAKNKNELFILADQHLYRAKSSGKNCCHYCAG